METEKDKPGALLLDEEICRKHVLELRRDIAVKANTFFRARRSGDSAATKRVQAALDEAKREAAEREGHYLTLHSDRLLAALTDDIAFIASEHLAPELRRETETLLAQARAWRKEIER